MLGIGKLIILLYFLMKEIAIGVIHLVMKYMKILNISLLFQMEIRYIDGKMILIETLI